MNILQIVSASRTGGVERHVVVLSDLLRQRGHRVTTFCPPGEWLPAQMRGAGLPVQEVAMHGMRQSYDIARAMPQFVRDHKIDLIHSHLTRATYLGYLTGRWTRLPVVSSVHVMTRDFVYRRLFPKPGNHIITVSEYLRDSLISQGIPAARVRTIHNGTNFGADFFASQSNASDPAHSASLRYDAARLEEREEREERELAGIREARDERAVSAGRPTGLRLRDDAGCQEEATGEEFETYRGGSSQASGTRLTVHSEWSVPQDAELIGLFGRIEEFKGPYVLTQAVRRIIMSRPRAYFFFVGPIAPDVQQALWEIADRDGVVDRLRFTGGRDDVPRLMAAMDVVTLPSRYEACSMAIIEAMMLGKPVVATRAGGNPELIRDGETGLLIERTPDALAQAIIRILADPLWKRQMGEAAQARAVRRFSAGVMVNQIEALYEEMTAKK